MLAARCSSSYMVHFSTMSFLFCVFRSNCDCFDYRCIRQLKRTPSTKRNWRIRLCAKCILLITHYITGKPDLIFSHITSCTSPSVRCTLPELSYQLRAPGCTSLPQIDQCQLIYFSIVLYHFHSLYSNCLAPIIDPLPILDEQFSWIEPTTDKAHLAYVKTRFTPCFL